MNELESKIIGMLKTFGDYGIDNITLSLDEKEKHILIEDRSNPFIITTKKLTLDQFVCSDVKMLIQIVRSIKND